MRIIGSRASGRNRKVGPHEAEIDREKGSAHVGDDIRDEKRGQPFVALCQDGLYAIVENAHAAHSGADDDAAAVFIEFIESSHRVLRFSSAFFPATIV